MTPATGHGVTSCLCILLATLLLASPGEWRAAEASRQADLGCRQEVNCRRPECVCPSSKPPLGMSPRDIPQLVYFTFDDAVTDFTSRAFNTLFPPQRTNPNGCPIPMTLFISHVSTKYNLVRSFYERGMELAVHSVNHRHIRTDHDMLYEAVQQRKNIAAEAGVPIDAIKGWRSPFLLPHGNKQMEILKDNGFLYDSTLTIERAGIDGYTYWPLTLDYGWPYPCMVVPCPTGNFTGFWEVPIVSVLDYQKTFPCQYIDGCVQPPPDEEAAFLYLWQNFESYYRKSRAPFGINMHAAWFAWPERLAGMDRFIQELGKLDDVYIVTVQQLIEYMKNPVKLSDVRTFAPFRCDSNNLIKSAGGSLSGPQPRPTTRRTTTRKPNTRRTTRRPTTWQPPTRKVPTWRSPITDPTTRRPATRRTTTRRTTTWRPPTRKVPTWRAPTTWGPTTRQTTTWRLPTRKVPTWRAPTTQPSTRRPTTRQITTSRPPTRKMPTWRAPTTRPTTWRPATRRSTTWRSPTRKIPTTVRPVTRQTTKSRPVTRSTTRRTPTTWPIKSTRRTTTWRQSTRRRTTKQTTRIPTTVRTTVRRTTRRTTVPTIRRMPTPTTRRSTRRTTRWATTRGSMSITTPASTKRTTRNTVRRTIPTTTTRRTTPATPPKLITTTAQTADWRYRTATPWWNIILNPVTDQNWWLETRSPPVSTSHPWWKTERRTPYNRPTPAPTTVHVTPTTRRTTRVPTTTRRFRLKLTEIIPKPTTAPSWAYWTRHTDDWKPTRRSRVLPTFGPDMHRPIAQPASGERSARREECLQGVNCFVPNCFCDGKQNPQRVPLEKRPQLIYITFEGPISSQIYIEFVRIYSSRRRNPNGCPIKATFFVPSSSTDPGYTKTLYERGNEISLLAHPGDPIRQRDLLSVRSGIPKLDIKGWRAENLVPLSQTFYDILPKYGFKYDSTMITTREKSGEQRWPLTLDFGWTRQCNIHPCPTDPHPGVWEVPVTASYDNHGLYPCTYMDGCHIQPQTTNDTYKQLWDNFQTFYTRNRAPFGIHLRQTWFHYFYLFKLDALNDFIEKLVSMEDVYLVTISEMLDWMKDPVPLDELTNFQSWQCF